MHWYSLFGRFGEKDNDWWSGLQKVSLPVLAIGSDGDIQDPAWACRKLLEQFGSQVRQFLHLGKRQGFSEDFGHVEMLISKGAQREVWPLLQHWLEHGALPEGQGALAQA